MLSNPRPGHNRGPDVDRLELRVVNKICTSWHGIDGVVLSLAADYNVAIFIEKPVAESTSDVQSLVQLCKSQDLALCYALIHYTLLWLRR